MLWRVTTVMIAKMPNRKTLKIVIVVATLLALKWLWVTISTADHGTFASEKA